MRFGAFFYHAMKAIPTKSAYLDAIRERVLVFDGAMGTNIQRHHLTPDDFGGKSLEGCNDHLVLTRPDVIQGIHESFLAVGCDVVETCTFQSTPHRLREWGIEEKTHDLNLAAARLGRAACDRFAKSGRPRFVAGSIGPTGMLPSSSDPVLSRITFRALEDTYYAQARALIEGGVDVLLVETAQDILEVKAAIAGFERLFADLGFRVPIQAQVTLDTSGRMLLGTDVASALVTLESLPVDVIGLNCSTGPEHMREPVRYLTSHARLPISCIPNAGLPLNTGTGDAVYPLEPVPMAEMLGEFVHDFGVRIVGGCCGTTPEHLAAIVETVRSTSDVRRSTFDVTRSGGSKQPPSVSSAMRATTLRQEPPPLLIGERVNSQGSRKVKRLLLADDYDGILDVAKEQVESGAHVLDVCVALTERADEAEQMSKVVKLLSMSVEAPHHDRLHRGRRDRAGARARSRTRDHQLHQHGERSRANRQGGAAREEARRRPGRADDRRDRDGQDARAEARGREEDLRHRRRRIRARARGSHLRRPDVHARDRRRGVDQLGDRDDRGHQG